MGTTKIEWADEVWNPVWGCLNNCPYCYARSIAKRFGKTPRQKTFYPMWMENNFNRKFRKDTKRVFVNSMSDVAYWRPEWWSRVLDKISQYSDIEFIFLTKEKSCVAYPEFYFNPDNCILGETFTDPNRASTTLDHLHRKLLNIEPLLYPQLTPIPVQHFDWIIIGAETGNRKDKPIPALDWYQQICVDAINKGIPLFIKPSLKDITPPELYRQEFPKRREQ